MRASAWRALGPGLLWAGASIGVSHLVQSTRAGAVAGFGLAALIVVVLIVKYPFFEYGARYAAATGHSLVEGYRRIGRWALVLYLGITVVTSLIVQAAVVLFTAFLLNRAFGLSWSLPVTGAVVCGVSAVMLFVGRFKLLDWSIKVVLALLALSTLVAAAAALPAAPLETFALVPLDGAVTFGFVIALVGWMPTAFDLSVWSSLWTLAKDGQRGERTTVQDARLDFNVGYIGTGVLAIAFVTLGATVMYQSGDEFSAQGTVFATQLIDLYAATLGEWARVVVTIAVLTTMISTSVTVVDGFPRALERSILVLRDDGESDQIEESGRWYWTSMAVLMVLTVLVFVWFLGSLTDMVDFATTVSFMTAPVLGVLNLMAVRSDSVPEAERPGRAMLIVSYLGLVLLGGTAVGYAVWRFFL